MQRSSSIFLFFILASVSLTACGSDNAKTNPIIIIIEDTNDGKTVGDMGLVKDVGFGSDTNISHNNLSDVSELDEGSGENLESIRVLFEKKGLQITNSQSPLFAFDVPAGARSIAVEITGRESEFYVLSSWTNGDRSILVPNNWFQNSKAGPTLCTNCLNRVAGTEAVSVAFAPNNQNVEIKRGQHTAAVFGYVQNGYQPQYLQNALVDVRVVGVFSEEKPIAKLGINFHFTGAYGLTATKAKTDPSFQKTIQEFKNIYAQAKIELDPITYTDIDSSFQIIESIMAPNSDLQQMFKTGIASAPRGVNLYLVDELLLEKPGQSGFGVLLGVAGGIPGPSVAGSLRSGVAIAMKRVHGIPTKPSAVMAHETGHYLGLFHTTEQSQGRPAIHDQIDDTPQDDSSLLMYFSGVGNTLSPHQIDVMRLNPWIRFEEEVQ